MKKIKLFALALMASFSLSAMAETVTFTASEIVAGTTKSNVSVLVGEGQSTTDKTFAGVSKTKVISLSSSCSTKTDVKEAKSGTGFGFTVPEDASITSIKVHAISNSTTAGTSAVLFWEEASPLGDDLKGADLLTLVGSGESDEANTLQEITVPSGARTVMFLKRAKVDSDTNPTKVATAKNYPSSGNQTPLIRDVEITYSLNCTEPETALDIVPAESGPYYVGNTIHFSLPGGNGSAKALTLDGVAYDYLQWLMEEGEHTFAVSQDLYNGICGGSAELTINVLSQNPVTSCSIDGPATGTIGAQLTYTATAANAATYEWYVDGVAANNNSATFTYTATLGNHVIKAFATNDFTASPVESNEINVTVTKLCGELIKAAHTGGKTATVEGVVGGTYDKNTADNSKFGSKGQYFGITLADGEKFQRTDTLNVHTTTAAGQGTIAIYADKDGNTLLYDTESMGVAGDNEIVLPAALDGLSTLYICRTEGNTWNGFVDYISVSRSCEESDNANIDKVWVKTGETEKQYYEPESDGVTYNLVVPASVDIAEVDVYFSLEHPLATPDQSSPIHFIVPAAGDPAVSETIVVTAENDDTKTYTINVSKSAAASTEAHLSSLSVNGFTLDPVFDENTFAYTITKPFGAANPGTDAVVAEPADPTAHPHTEAVGDQLVVTVTAEDNTTTLEYTITINTAEAPKTLEHVLFANGFDAFIDNAARTVKAYYLAGEAAPEAVQITAGSGTAGAMTGNKIGVTGADMSYVEYTVTLEEVTPYTDAVAADAEAGVFDGTETWIKTGILESGNAAGFSDNYYVIRRQKKGSDAADDQRVFAGYVRAYLFVGNASELQLTIGGNKAVKYAVDGGEYTEDGDGTLNIALEEGNHLVEIVSNQQSGDGRISAPKLIERGSSTALDEAAGEVKARKIVRDGQIIIVRGDKEFNLVGAEL